MELNSKAGEERLSEGLKAAEKSGSERSRRLSNFIHSLKRR